MANALASSCSWLSASLVARVIGLLSSDASRELAGVLIFAYDRSSVARRLFLASLPARKSVELDRQACGDELNQLAIVQGKLDKERRVVSGNQVMLTRKKLFGSMSKNVAWVIAVPAQMRHSRIF